MSSRLGQTSQQKLSLARLYCSHQSPCKLHLEASPREGCPYCQGGETPWAEEGGSRELVKPGKVYERMQNVWLACFKGAETKPTQNWELWPILYVLVPTATA